MRRRQKIVLAAALVAGVATLVAAAPVSLRWIRERRELARLDSTSERERAAAIDRLGGMRSRRAGPRLLRLLEEGDPVGHRAVAALVRIGDRQAIPRLDEILSSKDPAFRRRAIGLLAGVRENHDLLLDVLAAAYLGDRGDSELLATAMETILRLDLDVAAPFVEALRRNPRDPLAMRALQSLGERAQGAEPLLSEILHGDGRAGEEAAIALAAIGPAAMPSLLGALRGDDARVRARAARAFGWLRGDPAKAVPELAEAIRDPDREVRKRAIEALGRLGPAARDAEADLVAALRDPAFVEPARDGRAIASDPDCDDLRVTMANALRGLDASSPEAVEALVGALSLGNPCLRGVAIDGLGELGPAAKGAAPALVAILDGPEPPPSGRGLPGGRPARHRAAEALGRLGAATPEVLSALAAAVEDEDRELQALATRAIGALGPPALGAAPAILRALGRLPAAATAHDAELLDAAIVALPAMGPPAIPLLAGSLGDDGPGRRLGAALALADLGPTAAETVPSLLGRLDLEEDPLVRHAILRALGSIAPGDPRTLPALRAGLEDEDAGTREASLEALAAGAGSAPDLVVPILLTKLGDARVEGRDAIPRSLAGAGLRTPAVLAALQAALADPDPFVREASVAALATLGASGSSLLEALVAVLGEAGPRGRLPEAWRPRVAAAKALLGLGPAGEAEVLRALAHESPEVRKMAARALGQTGVPSPRFLEALEERLGDADPGVASEARSALRGLGARVY